MEYKYGMRLRGFSIGCQPMDGFVRREDDPTGVYYDIIVYNRPLNERECKEYALEEMESYKVIKEMVELFDENCGYSEERPANYYAEKIYSAGYRKASEVIDEFFEKIMKKIGSYEKDELFDSFAIRLIVNEARVNIKTKICLENDEMRQEVEK